MGEGMEVALMEQPPQEVLEKAAIYSREQQPWEMSVRELALHFETNINPLNPESSPGLTSEQVAERQLEKGKNIIDITTPSLTPSLEANKMAETAKQLEHNPETIGCDLDAAVLADLPRSLLERLCLRLIDSISREGRDFQELLPPTWSAAFSHWRKQQQHKATRYGKERLEGQKIIVCRDGGVTETQPSDIVEGDVVHLHAGETVVADMVVVTIPRASPVVISLTALNGIRSSLPRTVVCEEDPFTMCNNFIPAGSVVRSGECVAVVVATGARSTLGQVVQRAAALPHPYLPPGVPHLPSDANATLSTTTGITVNSRHVGTLLPLVTAVVLEKEVVAPPQGRLRVVKVAWGSNVYDVVGGEDGSLPLLDGLLAKEAEEAERAGRSAHPKRLLLRTFVRSSDTSVTDRLTPLLHSDLLGRLIVGSQLAGEALKSEAEPDQVDPVLRAVIAWSKHLPPVPNAPSASDYATPPGAYRYFPQLRLHASLHRQKEGSSTLLMIYGQADRVLNACNTAIRGSGVVPLSEAARKEMRGTLSGGPLNTSADRIVGFGVIELQQSDIHGAGMWDHFDDVSSFVNSLSRACYIGAVVTTSDTLTDTSVEAVRLMVDHGIKVWVVTQDTKEVAQAATQYLYDGPIPVHEGTAGVYKGDVTREESPVAAAASLHAGGKENIVRALVAAGEVVAMVGTTLSALPALAAAHLRVAAVPELHWEFPQDIRPNTFPIGVDGVDAASYIRGCCQLAIAPDGVGLLAHLLTKDRGGHDIGNSLPRGSGQGEEAGVSECDLQSEKEGCSDPPVE